MMRPPKNPRPRSYPWRRVNEEGGFSYCEGSALALPGFIAFAPEWLRCGAADAAHAIPAPESALRSLPSVAVSSAQVTAILNPTPGVGSEFTLFY